MIWVLSIYAGVVLPTVGWFLWCNHKTYHDKMKLIHWAYHSGSNGSQWIARAEALHEVSYEQHLWAMIKFKNPWTLYTKLHQLMLID